MAGVTMRDVAKKAGVSEATVSHVVNGNRGRVSEKTRARVLAAIEELDYTPNNVARSLASRATWTLGLVVADVIRSPFSAAIKGVEDVAMRFGYNVILCNTNDQDDRLEKATELLVSKRVDGIVFVLSSREYTSLPTAQLVRRKIPAVFVNHPSNNPEVPSVLVDNASGTFELTKQLIEMGHQRIACIHMPVQGRHAILAGKERLTGFLRAVEEYGIPQHPELIREGALGEEMGEATGYRITRELLEITDPPTALVCCNDYTAIGAMRACEALGRRVPEDIAIVGHDDISAGRYVRPTLSTVHQPFARAGEQATQLLVQLIWKRRGQKATLPNSAASAVPSTVPFEPSSVVKLPCSVVIRSSSGHMPA